MKKIITNSILLSSLFFGFTNVNAQETTLKYCGSTEKYLERLKLHPEIIDEERSLDQFTKEFEKQQGTFKSQQAPYIIPVVFHIVHQYGSENISDAQIVDAVRILNEDFRKLNEDTVDIVAQFKQIATDANIEFRLAKKDPNGNCTNGIDRIPSLETNIGDDGSKLNPWDRSKYLNIWVVKTISSGAAGFAYYPSSVTASPAIDGIVILSTYVGSVGTGSYFTSRALTHEVGHYLNLAHVWGSTNQPGVACGDDGVADTPETKGWTSCPLNNPIDCNPGVVENMQNYMDYAYCYRMYTANQCTRMQAALNSSASSRNNLWKSTNLTATGVDNNNPANCAPIAEYMPYNFTTVCAGGSVSFSDKSYNGSIETRTWTFTGGSPSTDTARNVNVTYSTPGTYDVSLTVSNTSGSSSKTRTGKIIVFPASTSLLPTYVMNFEDANSFNSEITTINSDGDAKKWSRVTNVGYNSSSCIKLDNLNALEGSLDEIILPALNLDGATNIQVTFKYSTKLKATTQSDKIRTLVSNNCGQTWVPRNSITGTTLAYSPTLTQTSAFTPSGTSMWKSASVTIPNSYAKANTMFKLEFTSGGGNNIYIDDINILGIVGYKDLNNLEDVINPVIAPNPFSSETKLSFNLVAGVENGSVSVFNLTGQEVLNLQNGNMIPGEYNYLITKEQLRANGIYFVKINLDGNELVKKLIVN